MDSKVKAGKFPLLFGAIWLLVGVPFLLLGINEIKTQQRYETEGVTVAGTVLGKRSETRRDSDNKGSTTYYYVEYRFTDANGQDHEAEGGVDHESWEQLAADSPVEIQYLIDEPQTSRVASNSSLLGGILMCGFAGIALIVGVTSLVFYLRRALEIKLLMTKGQRGEGTVKDVRASNLTINNVRQWVLDYEYRDMRGNLFQGTSQYLSPAAAGEWQRGDKGEIRYLADRPQRSLWLSASKQ